MKEYLDGLHSCLCGLEKLWYKNSPRGRLMALNGFNWGSGWSRNWWE